MRYIFLLLLLISEPTFAQDEYSYYDYDNEAPAETTAEEYEGEYEDGYEEEYSKFAEEVAEQINPIENPSLFSQVSNTTTAPVSKPPVIEELPDLNTVSSILNEENTLDDIKSRFPPTDLTYNGTNAFDPGPGMLGIWWRFYTQASSLFQIPAVSEEILIIEQEGKALWLQNAKTSKTLNTSSQRLLRLTLYDLFGHSFLVFHYADQDPQSQEVRDRQGYFIRVISDKGYMQMSKSPNFDPEESIYWKRFPTVKKDDDIN